MIMKIERLTTKCWNIRKKLSQEKKLKVKYIDLVEQNQPGIEVRNKKKRN